MPPHESRQNRAGDGIEVLEGLGKVEGIWVVVYIRVPCRVLFYKGAALYWGPKEGP